MNTRLDSAQHVDAETDLGPVFGTLADEDLTAVRAQLADAEARLRALRDELGEGWSTEGVQLETLPSGQASVFGEVRADRDRPWFRVELRPRNYFSEHNPWRPGQPPRPMQTDAWNVDGAVHVIVVRHVLNKKYPIEETGAELEELSFTAAPEAAAGLVAAVDELVALARSREPTVEAWAPPDS